MTTTDLADLDQVGATNWDAGRLEIDGDLYLRSVYVRTSGCVPSNRADVEYSLGRDWDQIKFVAGFGDESASGARGVLQVYADSKIILKQTLEKGETETVERSLVINGRRALTLRMVVTMLEVPGDDDCARPGIAALGDPILSRR